VGVSFRGRGGLEALFLFKMCWFYRFFEDHSLLTVILLLVFVSLFPFAALAFILLMVSGEKRCQG